ncbi:SH3 domain-containing protein [Actinophytocola sp.]|uniref:SH3 domain-containing protein n=1 Tax=Actinophytocola sp. TaxID=1872138 RepID=UPI003D6B2444
MKIKWSGKRTLIAAALLVGVLWLYAMGSEQRRGDDDGGADTTSSTTQCRVEATVDGLNVRSAPELDPNNIVGEMNLSDQADAEKTQENGFRKLAEGRWVSVEFIETVEGRDCG